jgi:ABC-type antimicrobial peptide transport system permease subunit
VEDTYLNYLGRMAVCSEAAYRKIFGKAPVDNCYYVLLDGYDRAAFETMLANTSGGFVAEASNYYMTQLKGTLMLYNIIVVISIGIAVIMSFIILTNLASIFLNRKKKELIVMRINGFSIRETINYLVKETVVTALGGLLLGILIGVIMTPFFIGIIEPPDCTYIRSTHWNAWLIAFIVEGIFTVIINGSVFRRVRTLNFHEIM